MNDFETKYLVNPSCATNEVFAALEDYSRYVHSLRSTAPKGFLAYAGSEQHLDFSNHKCPHDGKVISVDCSGSKDYHTNFPDTLVVDILSAHGDWIVTFWYSDIEDFSLQTPVGFWYFDELLYEDGVFIHTIHFISERVWRVSSKQFDVTYKRVSG